MRRLVLGARPGDRLFLYGELLVFTDIRHIGLILHKLLLMAFKSKMWMVTRRTSSTKVYSELGDGCEILHDLYKAIVCSDGYCIVDDEMFEIMVRPLPAGCYMEV